MNKGLKIGLGLAKLVAFIGSIGGVVYVSKRTLEKKNDLYQRYRAYYTTANQWLMNKNDNKDISKYFKSNGYKTIAIYGMGTMGELFYEDIKKTDIKVAYFIDKNAEELYYGLDDISVVGLDNISSQEPVDAIIVTPVYDYDEISESLEKVGIDAQIISLEDIIYEA